MKIYFAGSIRGGRRDRGLYKKIINLLSSYGTVLTEHIGNKEISSKGEYKSSDSYIYKRDMNWLKSANIVIAEVTTPSLGVGYEIAKAEILGKKTICVYRKIKGRKISAMIGGSPNLILEQYKSINDLKKIFNEIFIK